MGKGRAYEPNIWKEGKIDRHTEFRNSRRDEPIDGKGEKGIQIGSKRKGRPSWRRGERLLELRVGDRDQPCCYMTKVARGGKGKGGRGNS